MPEYIVVKAGNIRELEEAVNRHLQEGHQLVGGVAITSQQIGAGISIMYAQALEKP